MKIGILMPSLKQGGTERVVSYLTEYLAARHECYLILLDASGFDYSYKGTLVDLKLPEPGERHLWKRLKNSVLAVSRINRIKRELDLDVLFSALEPANIPNVLSSRRGKTRAVLSIRDDKSYSPMHDMQRRIVDFMVRRFYNRADLIITNAKGSRRTLIEDYGLDADKNKVIYNPIDLARVRKAAEEPLDASAEEIFRGPVVIASGRLTRQKAHWHLIRAFSAVSRERPEARLVILGEGELREKLTDLRDKLGLKDRCFLLGYQHNPFKFVRRAAVFVLSSIWEGLPNVVLETLSLGVPVVAADIHSGPREILAPDTDFIDVTSTLETAKYGILVPPLDGEFHGAEEPLTAAEKILAEGMRQVLVDPALAGEYSRLGPQRADDFRLDVILPQYERCLLSVVQ